MAAAEPGIALSDPDVFALDSLDSVFNSFGGQLFDTLRSKEGLAYSVSGGWDSPPDHPGLFLAGRRSGRARDQPGQVRMYGCGCSSGGRAAVRGVCSVLQGLPAGCGVGWQGCQDNDCWLGNL